MFVYFTGDKDNHRPTIHTAMISHALFISGTIIVLTSQRSKPRSSLYPLILAGFIGVLSGVFLIWGSQDHPFLLADNR